MIKNFENFVNEGFWDNIGAAVDAGMQGYKINKSVQKAADEEQEKLLRTYGGGKSRSKVSKKFQMTRVIQLLYKRASWLAWSFSYEKDEKEPYRIEGSIERIEELVAKLKELINSKEEDFENE